MFRNSIRFKVNRLLQVRLHAFWMTLLLRDIDGLEGVRCTERLATEQLDTESIEWTDALGIECLSVLVSRASLLSPVSRSLALSLHSFSFA